MKIKDVLILKDAVNDLDDGKSFYDNKEAGVGDYFWDSLLSDSQRTMYKQEFVDWKQPGS
ncbi:MAG: hypothetical protein GY749_20620 [Desulfobacteraceae bacterium]|nr:hypothetical protein [Desulfobacteraceae bacterium]